MLAAIFAPNDIGTPVGETGGGEGIGGPGGTQSTASGLAAWQNQAFHAQNGS